MISRQVTQAIEFIFSFPKRKKKERKVQPYAKVGLLQ